MHSNLNGLPALTIDPPTDLPPAATQPPTSTASLHGSPALVHQMVTRACVTLLYADHMHQISYVLYLLYCTAT